MQKAEAPGVRRNLLGSERRRAEKYRCCKGPSLSGVKAPSDENLRYSNQAVSELRITITVRDAERINNRPGAPKRAQASWTCSIGYREAQAFSFHHGVRRNRPVRDQAGGQENLAGQSDVVPRTILCT